MAKLFHSNISRLTDLTGQPYVGVDRELLSKLLGGDVGFAYGYLPEGWDKPYIYELDVHPETPIAIDLTGDGLPRRHYYTTRIKPDHKRQKLVEIKTHIDFYMWIYNPKRVWLGRFCDIPDPFPSQYEVAFLAEGVRFGRSVV